MVGVSQGRLRVVASKVQEQSEYNALSAAVAGQRVKEEEFKADAEYRAAGNMIRNAELNIQEEAEIAHRRMRAEGATRLRAIGMDRQHELNVKEVNEQRFRDEPGARNMQQRLIELEHQSCATTEDLVNLSELKQRELTLREEWAYKGRFQTQFKEEERRVRALAESMVRAKESKMQMAFDGKYQSQFNVMQAGLANQFAVLQSDRDKMKLDWYNLTGSKNQVEILKQRLLGIQKAFDKVSRPGSSHDAPVNTASAIGTIVKVITETITEENGPKPPNRPGGHGGGGGGDGGNPGDPSDPGRASP